MTQPDAPGSAAAGHALELRLQAVLHELATSRATVASLRRQLAAEAEKTAAMSDRFATVQQQAADLRRQLDDNAAALAASNIRLARLRQAMRHVPGWSIARAVVRYSRQPR